MFSLIWSLHSPSPNFFRPQKTKSGVGNVMKFSSVAAIFSYTPPNLIEYRRTISDKKLRTMNRVG